MSRAMRGAGPLRLVAHLGVWVYVLLLLVPLYYLAISSVKSNTAILDSPFNPFRGLQFDNFARAWEGGSLGRGLINQAYITVAANILTLALAVPAAFALARTRGRVGRIIERIFALGFLVPGFAALVPTVLLAIRLDLFHTREFLILLLPASALPLSVVLLTQAMRTVPAELEESAIIDGAGPLRVLVSVYAPLTLPTLTVVLILNFLSFWNEYFFALVIAGPDPAVRTAQVALPLLSMANAAQYGVLAAGIVITLVPVYLVYVLFADKMEGAVFSGALKG
ncbi:carbohydrate ABC transporter permease [Kribbella sandramycini]|uniref:Multiple sugar transport system permease protein n=2 Tax=Kribbella sandramycini TaxID=60450 RepID=A0A841SG66_9ACTN|nr:carbohydrate ABC transporter permease [Kribbella sandramycini]MBB6567076.1 multiple sugar transport system permease protein [Kribbella sandramycini]